MPVNLSSTLADHRAWLLRWEDTVASQCRYGSIAARIFGDAEIIWEDAKDDYQGYASVLARLPDGQFVHYEWTYGSCSGCDDWEDRDLSDDQIEAEMRDSMAVFADRDVLERYLKVKTQLRPAADVLERRLSEPFQAMGQAYVDWSTRQDLHPPT